VLDEDHDVARWRLGLRHAMRLVRKPERGRATYFGWIGYHIEVQTEVILSRCHIAADDIDSCGMETRMSTETPVSGYTH